MKRYFGKIDENKKDISWEFNNNEVFFISLNSFFNSKYSWHGSGNLFSVLEKIDENKFKVLFLSESSNGMDDYFNFDEFTPADAYYWAREIGNQDVMIDRITNAEYAYYWAGTIGNREIMINKITESDYAYFWARDIGNKDVMIDRITASVFAYRWAKDIGNRDVMIDRITDSEYAYKWALDIGNRDVMINRITDSAYAFYWARYIGDRDIMRKKITNEYWMSELEKLK